MATTFKSVCFAFLSGLMSGCATGRQTEATPRPELPSPAIPQIPSTESWTIRYTPGIRQYHISRNAAIEIYSDSGLHREISTNVSHEAIQLDSVGDMLRIRAILDTFAITTQGMIGAVQQTTMPVQMSAILMGGGITADGPEILQGCSPAQSALLADVYNLIPPLPPVISSGMKWTDSLSFKSCQGGVLTSVQLLRSFVVLGQTNITSQPEILIQRTDSLNTGGEGAQQQHRVLVESKGVGHATYYLDTRAALVTRLTTTQTLQLVVTTSGRTSHFRQTSQQEFILAR